METRILGRTGRPVSVVGLGTWQLGADWGDVDDRTAHDVLRAAHDGGVTFFDTADVYGDGRSERLVAEALGDVRDQVVIATKFGRRADQVPENFTAANFREWIDRSRRNLGTETVDLVQLHCPPGAVYEDDRVYDALDALVADGSIAAYGVSVEEVGQALTAIARPGVASVQIILNAFRLRPLDRVLPAATEAGVGVIARVPLASGLLSGKYDESTTFAADDHRTYNRDGSSFDVGETFAGVDFETGVQAARDFSALVEREAPEGVTPAQAAIAWIAQLEGLSTVIPGARSVRQAESNAAAGLVPDLGEAFRAGVAEIYDREFRAAVHDRW